MHNTKKVITVQNKVLRKNYLNSCLVHYITLYGENNVCRQNCLIENLWLNSKICEWGKYIIVTWIFKGKCIKQRGLKIYKALNHLWLFILMVKAMYYRVYYWYSLVQLRSEKMYLSILVHMIYNTFVDVSFVPLHTT